MPAHGVITRPCWPRPPPEPSRAGEERAMPEVGHVVVIGGGAAGCATAYHLSAAGVRVTIVEREGIGTQASGWSAGGLNPLQGIPEPLAAFAMASYRLHLALWPELERLTGQKLGGRRISMALVAPDD